MAVVAAPARRSWLRVFLAALGAAVTVVVIGIGALLLLDAVARHTATTTSHYANVRRLIVQTGAGDVTLTAAPVGDAVVVKTSRTESLFKPKVQVTMTPAGTLMLTARCPNQLGCGVHYQLSVPQDVAIKVSSGFGDIHANGLTSTSSIQLGTTAGGIDALRLNAPEITLSTGLGGLTADLAEPARRLSATTVAGDVNLTVSDLSYALHVSSGVGHVSDGDVPDDPASPRTITARSSLGNIAINVGR
jgi:hypothetical protein